MEELKIYFFCAFFVYTYSSKASAENIPSDDIKTEQASTKDSEHVSVPPPPFLTPPSKPRAPLPGFPLDCGSFSICKGPQSMINRGRCCQWTRKEWQQCMEPCNPYGNGPYFECYIDAIKNLCECHKRFPCPPAILRKIITIC
ncbi:uncharacterized protein LOC130647446 [Hydractinia symbiolongicarpus]|uniref:uncharacterized protein LOC130647446 n=1 Tax=Hydractinia symbiolongicarpus TaxID=13093 RepID=UPI00254CA753|nr:uncharacterized protein LOC130647446 [Hydractinia symbiolongicarpus]